jgi:beta-barrel assembly-enhancing protease
MSPKAVEYRRRPPRGVSQLGSGPALTRAESLVSAMSCAFTLQQLGRSMIATRMNTKLSSRWLLAAALATAFPAPPLWAQPSTRSETSDVRLPSLGESAGDDFSVGTERRLGEQIMAEVRRDPAYLDDPLLLDHLQSMWLPLVAAARSRGNVSADLDSTFAWEAFLVRDRSINAFALPGGYVGVHLGLMAATATRDELASVLAHELSHVTQRHIARSIANSSRQSLVGMAALLLGVLAASRASSADATQAVIVGSQAAVVQGQLNFSRDMEREADRIGWGVHQSAGFAPQGMAAMFERLENAYRLTDSGAFPYLRSHPLTVDRIGEARARLEATPAIASRAPLRPTLDHQLMQARARVLMDTGVQALRRWQAMEAGTLSGGERLAALYASALASLELREPARAQAALDAAAVLAPKEGDNPRATFAIGALQAQVWQASGQAPRALAWFEAQRSPTAGPATRPLMLLRAQAAIDVARVGAAGAVNASLRGSTEALQTWVAEHKIDATAWSLLAQGADLLGLKLRSMRADGEAAAARGDLVGAIDRLRAAQRQARGGSGSGSGSAPDFIEASIIDARLRDLTALRRAQLAEARGDKSSDRERER